MSGTPPDADNTSPTTDSSRTTQKSGPASPMPRDKQGWRVAPAPDGRGTPDAAQAAARPTAGAGFWIFVRRAARAQLAVGADRSSRRREPRVKVPFSPYFLDQLEARPGRSRSPPRATRSRARSRRKLRYPPNDDEGDADDAVRDRRCRRSGTTAELTDAAAVQGRPGQRQVTRIRARSLLARAAARLRPDAADRRAVRAARPRARCPAAGRGRAGQLRALAGAAGRPARRSGSRSTTSPGSTRPRPS